MQTDQMRSGNRPYTGRFVSERALVDRINRRLLWSGKRIRRTRGRWYTLDLSSCIDGSYLVIGNFSDLEPYGRELGCLRSDEVYRPWAPSSVQFQPASLGVQ